MITNAFTRTGPYAVLIMLGIKRVENRSMMPVPAKGRCAVSCSKTFNAAEYGAFVAWAAASSRPPYHDGALGDMLGVKVLDHLVLGGENTANDTIAAGGSTVGGQMGSWTRNTTLRRRRRRSSSR